MPDSGTMDYVLVSSRYRQKHRPFIFSILLTPKAIFMTYRWSRKRGKILLH